MAGDASFARPMLRYELETDRQTNRQTQRDRQADRQSHQETESLRDRVTKRQIDAERYGRSKAEKTTQNDA